VTASVGEIVGSGVFCVHADTSKTSAMSENNNFLGHISYKKNRPLLYWNSKKVKYKKNIKADMI